MSEYTDTLQFQVVRIKSNWSELDFGPNSDF